MSQGAGKEVYSNFGFFNALQNQSVGDALITGESIDIQSYEAVTFIVNVGATTGATATFAATDHEFQLQHGLASAAGVSTWSVVPYGSQLIHSVVSQGQTLTSGVWQLIASYTQASTVYAVGYKKDKDHRYVRLMVSASGAPSIFSALGAIAICGFPNNWPINTPAQ